MEQCVNAQFVSYVMYEIKSMDTCVARTLFAFIHDLLFFAPVHVHTNILSHSHTSTFILCVQWAWFWFRHLRDGWNTCLVG